MPYLILGADRRPLLPGDNLLHGCSHDAGRPTPAAQDPAISSIAVYPDGSAAIQRLDRDAVIRVNKRRLGAAPRLLRHGDRIVVGKDRFTFDASSVEEEAVVATPAVAAEKTRVLPAVPAPAPVSSRAPAPVPAPIAVLEVVRGPLAGRSWPVDRAVVALGRGTDNDVRIADDSVSSSHATLLLKGDEWYVVDLRSSNGTFVDGYRISGERALTRSSTLRLGAVEMMLRPVSQRGAAGKGTQHLPGFAERFAKLW